MKERFIRAHMRVALEYAKLSYCKRKQVGCVVVKDDRIISIGFNGTPPGWINCCEDANGKTLLEVFHAEANAIAKLAKSSGDGKGASVFITCTPCLNCAKLLVQIEIKELYYYEEYRGLTEGADFLRACGIPVTHLQDIN